VTALATPARIRAIRHGLILAGSIFTGYYVLLAAVGIVFGDAHIYWSTRMETLYQGYVVGATANAYSPAFAQAMAPLRLLPWPVFVVLWETLLLATFAWLVRPVPREWWLPLLLIAGPDILTGNIHLPLAAAVVAGFRFPASWAFVILTKVTPGVGLVWFVARREWRSVLVALAATTVVAVVSFAMAPGLWFEWGNVLASNRDAAGVSALSVPLWIRLPVAFVIVVVAASRNVRWPLIVAVLLAMPHIWIQSLALLVAVPRLVLGEYRTDPEERRGSGSRRIQHQPRSVAGA
jgi:hypothetical protein